MLISAGVGLTPMMSMLETLAAWEEPIPIWYLHACENPQQHSFKARLAQLQQKLPQLRCYTWYNQPQPQNSGLLNGLMQLSQVANELPLQTGQFYICGPTGFMKFAKAQLLALGVNAECIHYEVFGPRSDL